MAAVHSPPAAVQRCQVHRARPCQHPRDQRPAIIVADTGIGIAPEDVPRVFEKGYTGYNGRGGQKSTGLGLYLVHQTAEMLHCRVSLSSRIGEGTSVTIDLHQEELGKE